MEQVVSLGQHCQAAGVSQSLLLLGNIQSARECSNDSPSGF